MNVKRGDVVLVNLEPVMGSEQGKIRPCLVVQNDISNRFSSTTIVVPLTSVVTDREYPTNVLVEPPESGLKQRSTLLCNQIRVVSIPDRFLKKLSSLNRETMLRVNEALKASLGLDG